MSAEPESQFARAMRVNAIAHQQYWRGYDRGVIDGASRGCVVPPNLFAQPPAAHFVQRIREYLSVGGLFNPEMMDHEKVRNLLLEIKDYLDMKHDPTNQSPEESRFWADAEKQADALAVRECKDLYQAAKLRADNAEGQLALAVTELNSVRSQIERIQEVLYDGNLVLSHLMERERGFTTPENVSAVLDAFKRAVTTPIKS